MRIVAGEHRGRIIQVPAGLDTRPTTDRVREAVMSSIFSILGTFEGVCVLDAFSGSGAMALEALSRGAAFALLNDISAASRSAIGANVRALHLRQDEAEVSSVDILKAGLPKRAEPFDLVFLDPPYATEQAIVAKMIVGSLESGALSKDALIVYEHDEAASRVFKDVGLQIIKERKYGKTYVSYVTGESGE